MLSYSTKKFLLKPYVLIQQWRYRKLPKLDRAILAANLYRPAIFQFYQAYAEKDILHTFDLDKSSTVVDIGGYVGEWAEHIERKYNPYMHIFEPMPSAIKQLEEKFAKNPKISIYPWALSNYVGQENLVLKGPGSTIHTSVQSNHGKVNIAVKDAAEALEDIGNIDLLKINIEGAEYQVLPRLLEAGVINHCKGVVIQFHEWHPNAKRLRKEIRNKLAYTHQCHWNYEFVWEYWYRTVI